MAFQTGSIDKNGLARTPDGKLYVTTGGQIPFPATQSPSADPNTLDDYEEGTFTPTIILGSGSVTYTTQTGTYTKIGRLVVVQINIIINAVTTPSGTLQVGALPFTSSATAKGAVAIQAGAWAAAATTSIVGSVDPNATTIRVYKYAAGALSNPGADLQAASSIAITAMYEAS